MIILLCRRDITKRSQSINEKLKAFKKVESTLEFLASIREKYNDLEEEATRLLDEALSTREFYAEGKLNRLKLNQSFLNFEFFIF
jgi:hypothetical protein